MSAPVTALPLGSASQGDHFGHLVGLEEPFHGLLRGGWASFDRRAYSAVQGADRHRLRDTARFARVLKRAFGVTPSAVRRAALEGTG
jgi:AraC-like DNA-binding protein